MTITGVLHFLDDPNAIREDRERVFEPLITVGTFRGRTTSTYICLTSDPV